MNAINKLKLSLSAVLFSFLGIACSDIDDNLVNYPVVAEVIPSTTLFGVGK